MLFQVAYVKLEEQEEPLHSWLCQVKYNQLFEVVYVIKERLGVDKVKSSSHEATP